MKTLADGKQVTSRSFYYLLDWRDRHHDEYPLLNYFCKERLIDLTIDEYIRFFEIATTQDKKEMGVTNQI